MKKACLLFTLTLLFFTAQGQMVISSGQTLNIVPNVSYNTNAGIIIEDGGVLNFQGGAVHIGLDNEIRIEAGGQITGDGGMIRPAVKYQHWMGIFIEPIASSGVNNIPAIDVANISIRGSNWGIQTGYTNDPIPSIIMDNVAMANNVETNLFLNSSLPHDNGSSITNCTFYPTSSGSWPIYIGHVRNMEFINCYFAGGARPLHFDWAHDITIRDCEFTDYIQAGLTMHYGTSNVSITRNTFQSEHEGAHGIDFTEGITGGTVEGAVISRNIIYGNGGGTGITAEGSAIFSNVSISWNQIKSANGITNGFDQGIWIKSANDGNNIIYRNRITGCETGGLVFSGENPNMKIACNRFLNNETHIIILGTLADQIGNGEVNYDPQNYFSTTQFDIDNVGGGSFTYYFNPSNPIAYKPTNSNNVNLVQTHNNWCFIIIEDDKELELNSTNEKIVVYPNPASGHFSIANLPEAADQIFVSDLTGRNVRSFLINEDGNYPVNDLAPGSYVLRIVDAEGITINSSLLVINRLGGHFTN